MCERELNTAYRQEKRWPELVDLFCYSLDTALAGEYVGYLSSHGVDLQSRLESSLAEVVLEACGRFEEAALLYLESAQNESYEAQSIHNAGLAYKRAGMYSEAEALYHQSLRKTLRHSEQTRGHIGIPEALHVGLLKTCSCYTRQRRQPKSGPRATWRRTCSTARPGPGRFKRRSKINP